MAKQLEFEKVKGWGGKRRGAGRPNLTGKVSHAKRENVDFRTPLHITMKLKKGIANLRTKEILKSFRKSAAEAKRLGLNIIHFSLQNDHLHMIVEAQNKKKLALGMRSFTIRFAKAIRKIIGGAGAVFKGRYHVHVLKTPTEVKRALEYVLLNSAKHSKLLEHIDQFSSGLAFKEWRQLLGKRYRALIESQYRDAPVTYDELSLPRSWLCRLGWMRAR